MPTLESLYLIIARNNSEIARLKADIASLEVDLVEWRYSHDEVEAACGGEVAQQVRAAVLTRREEILQEAP